MSSKPVFVVVGATGAQGSSVANVLLNDGRFKVRACTRYTSSANAKALEDKGAELASFDWDNRELIEKAFEGAYGVFGLTDFWRVGYEREIKHGRDMVDIAKEKGVKHFIWSTLDDSNVPHFESKYQVDVYLKQSGLPHTSIYTSCFYENLFTFFVPARQPDGTYLLDIMAPTDAPGPWMAVEDLGHWVLAALKDPKTWIGKDMRVVGDYISVRDITNILSEVSGKVFKPVERSMEEFKALGNELEDPAKEIWLNFHFFCNNSRQLRDLDLSRKLYPGTQDFRTWAKKHVDKLLK